MVQLLYFLPKMSQPLLANLSSCCTAGRISAGLAASLIRIIHLRWAFRPALESTWTQLCLTADGCWHTGTQTTLCLITIRWQCCSFTDKSVTAFMIYYLLVDINWDEYSVFLIFNFLVTIKPLFFFNYILFYYHPQLTFLCDDICVLPCLTLFLCQWGSVIQIWSVCTGVCVCVSRVLYKELFLRLECRIVMEYWEDGLHVSPGLYETPCYSHTFLTVTNLYSPTGQGRSFHNYISVCCYS